MSFKANWFRERLIKRARKGFQGYPVASVAYYGPTAERATKVAVGITLVEGAEAGPLERWYSNQEDARSNASIVEEIVHFLQKFNVKSVVMPDKILGCPHEEGIDYPDGEQCMACPYWLNRDRFTGLLHGARGEA
jgi:hypothetical protein